MVDLGTTNTPPGGGDTGPVWAVAFSLDGATLASAGAGGTVRLWDTGTGALRLSRFRYVAAVADGRFSSVIDQVPLATAFARTVLSMQK